MGRRKKYRREEDLTQAEIEMIKNVLYIPDMMALPEKLGCKWETVQRILKREQLEAEERSRREHAAMYGPPVTRRKTMLSAVDVRAIRRSTLSLKTLARRYGRSYQLIWAIKNRTKYTNVKEED